MWLNAVSCIHAFENIFCSLCNKAIFNALFCKNALKVFSVVTSKQL